MIPSGSFSRPVSAQIGMEGEVQRNLFLRWATNSHFSENHRQSQLTFFQDFLEILKLCVFLWLLMAKKSICLVSDFCLNEKQGKENIGKIVLFHPWQRRRGVQMRKKGDSFWPKVACGQMGNQSWTKDWLGKLGNAVEVKTGEIKLL